MSLHNKRRGNAAIFALTLIPLLGFGALSVDIGLQRMTVTQVQAAAEAASNGGAAYLNGSSEGLTNAVARAKLIGNLNYVYGDAFEIVDDDIQLGIYDPEADTPFTPVDVNYGSADGENAGDVNAIQVTPSHTIDSVLSRYAFGVTALGAAGDAMAIAQRGGVAKYVDCYLPFAIPKCHFLTLADGDNPGPMMLNLQATDTAGWALPNESPNTSSIIDQFEDGCSSGTAATGDDAELSNGTNVSPLSYVAESINNQYGNTTSWPANYFPAGPYFRGDLDGDGVISSEVQDPPGGDMAHPPGGGPGESSIDESADIWGTNISGVVPIVDQPCGDGFTGSAPIVGWTYAYLYDFNIKGGEKMLWFQFDFVNDYDIGYGQCEGDCFGNVTGTFPPTQVY